MFDLDILAVIANEFFLVAEIIGRHERHDAILTISTQV